MNRMCPGPIKFSMSCPCASEHAASSRASTSQFSKQFLPTAPNGHAVRVELAIARVRREARELPARDLRHLSHRPAVALVRRRLDCVTLDLVVALVVSLSEGGVAPSEPVVAARAVEELAEQHVLADRRTRSESRRPVDSHRHPRAHDQMRRVLAQRRAEGPRLDAACIPRKQFRSTSGALQKQSEATRRHRNAIGTRSECQHEQSERRAAPQGRALLPKRSAVSSGHEPLSHASTVASTPRSRRACRAPPRGANTRARTGLNRRWLSPGQAHPAPEMMCDAGAGRAVGSPARGGGRSWKAIKGYGRPRKASERPAEGSPTGGGGRSVEGHGRSWQVMAGHGRIWKVVEGSPAGGGVRARLRHTQRTADKSEMLGGVRCWAPWPAPASTRLSGSIRAQQW